MVCISEYVSIFVIFFIDPQVGELIHEALHDVVVKQEGAGLVREHDAMLLLLIFLSRHSQDLDLQVHFLGFWLASSIRVMGSSLALSRFFFWFNLLRESFSGRLIFSRLTFRALTVRNLAWVAANFETNAKGATANLLVANLEVIFFGGFIHPYPKLGSCHVREDALKRVKATF